MQLSFIKLFCETERNIFCAIYITLAILQHYTNQLVKSFQSSSFLTFYNHLFHTKVLCRAFPYLWIVFMFFLVNKELGDKVANKMLVKLTPELFSPKVQKQERRSGDFSSTQRKKKSLRSRLSCLTSSSAFLSDNLRN